MNKIPKGLAVSLGLKPAVANYRRTKLAEQGFVNITSSGRTKQISSLRMAITTCSLTPSVLTTLRSRSKGGLSTHWFLGTQRIVVRA